MSATRHRFVFSSYKLESEFGTCYRHNFETWLTYKVKCFVFAYSINNFPPLLIMI